MPTVKIPESLCARLVPDLKHEPESQLLIKALREKVKRLVESAIQEGITPADLPIAVESGISVHLSFPRPEDKAIRMLAKAETIRETDATLKFLYAAMARGETPIEPTGVADVMTPYLAGDGLDKRYHQSLFAEHLLTCMDDGHRHIGLVEAATGVGKTLAMIAAAAEKLRAVAFGRCLITVPTIQLLCQFAHQHNRLAATLPDLPAGRFVVGRNEFVCVAELRAVLKSGKEMIDPSPILHWLDAGGPPGGGTKDLDAPYTLAALREISPTFPVEAVRLTPDAPEDDPGAIAYAAQFLREEDESGAKEIIYCSHAMLAADLRRRFYAIRFLDSERDVTSAAKARVEEVRARAEQLAADNAAPSDLAGAKKEMAQAIEDRLRVLGEVIAAKDVGILPPWQYLLIDEAHAFESNLANALSATLSLSRYVRTIAELSSAGILSKASVQRASTALDVIRRSGRTDEINLAVDGPISHDIRAALAELSSVILDSKKARGPKVPALDAAKLQARIICTALKVAADGRHGRAILAYSPVRAYPQLHVGQSTVSSFLKVLWQSVTSGACVSATLYLNKISEDSAAYMAQVLSVPSSRLKTFPAIRPPWVFSPVKGLWTPEPKVVDGQFWLRPPSRRDNLSADAYRAAEGRWMDQVADAVGRIHATAEGGVLVLLGSYAAASGISARLADTIPLRITASQNHSLQEQIHHFVKLRKAGHKATWLAVGGAWTGLDINGKNYGIEDPLQDNLLTDLVIPRFPFGTNRSLTHQYRMEKQSGVPWEILDVSMRFRQGLGRPIRREGLPQNRRFFVLDGRINDPAFKNYVAILRRIMAAYPARELTFKPTESL